MPAYPISARTSHTPGSATRPDRARATREPGYEREPFSCAEVDERFVVADAEAVLDRHDLGFRLCDTKVVERDVREADHLDQAFALQLRECADGLGDRYAPVDGVELVEVDRLDAQESETLLELRPQRGRRPVGEPCPATVAVEAALGRDDKIVGVRGGCLADQPLADERPLSGRGVDERDAQLDCPQ